ncbi:opsin-5-like [Elysia marginata]|uniref:Opsin-5-like n=1 Tax=Elysia marginata TaxID=1093978 RepID=A0AAV4FU17_9GAST|nr:opsin-5-like [Elysia marginata]
MEYQLGLPDRNSPAIFELNTNLRFRFVVVVVVVVVVVLVVVVIVVVVVAVVDVVIAATAVKAISVFVLEITGVMCFTFVLFWTPYAVVAMIKSYARHVRLPVELSVVPALAAKTSHVIDPLIYCALNKNFSQHIPLLFKSKSSKLSEREFTTQSIPLKTIAAIDDNLQISSEA